MQQPMPATPPNAAAPSSASPPGAGRRRLLVFLLTGLVVLGLVAALLVWLVLRRPADGVPTGTLPPAPPVPTPPVVAELESRGLTCYDEATDPWLVKGCFLVAPGHLLTVRLKVDESATIEKLHVQVLHDDVSSTQLGIELADLAGPVLTAAGLSAADRRTVLAAVAENRAVDAEQLGWGTFELTNSLTEVRGLSLTRPSVQPSSMPEKPLLGSEAGLLGALSGLGYQCRTDDIGFDCAGKRDGESFSGARHLGRVLSLYVRFPDTLPAPDSPLFVDLYTALRQVGDPNSAALTEGVALLAGEGSERVYVNGYRILRWEHHLELGCVAFV